MVTPVSRPGFSPADHCMKYRQAQIKYGGEFRRMARPLSS